MESDWSVTSLDGRDVTLVTVDLRNPSPVDRRVRVSNRLDGPVLPPKRAGVPESGWNEEGFDGVVPAAGRRTLGYACPASARRPPVSIVDEGRADGDDADATATAIRELGDPRPPGDAIPGPEANEGDDPPVATDAVPPAVESWLTTVEARIDCGERLTDASVESVTVALDEADDVSDLSEQVSADAAALGAVAERAAALADRASAVDVPVEALRRLP
jgi:hypothetical protein